MKKYIVFVLSFICCCSSFAMAHNSASKPSVESYKTKILNADQQIIELIAERKGW